MKTNQVLERSSAFKQRTKDGYFDANTLLNNWNQNSGKKPLQMGNYRKNSSTISFIEQLKKEGIEKPVISGRGRAGTWMHPKLFVDFAMWVSVEFKSIVIDYVLDGLIKSRLDAGDYYNEMCASILTRHVEYYGKKPPAIVYITEARLIKSILGVEMKDRNLMTEDELSMITQLQKLNSLLISEGVGKESRVKQLKLQSKLLKM